MNFDQTEKIIRTNRFLIILLGILRAPALGAVLYLARSIVLPFALAVFIYYILNPLITFFEKRRVPKLFSIFLVLIITFTIFNLVGIIVFTSIKSFAANSKQLMEIS